MEKLFNHFEKVNTRRLDNAPKITGCEIFVQIMQKIQPGIVWIAAGPSIEKRGRSRSPPPGGVTVPKTPQLATRSRSRPVHAPSHDELEKKELEEMQK